jgi:hypothetical protein
MDRTRSARTVGIPAALETDSADVRDALATASAMWSSGDRGEALRWLRRAAEVATDAGDDERALQLFKATSLIGSLRPPPRAEPPQGAPVAAPAPAVAVPAAIPAAAEAAPPPAAPAPEPPAAPDLLSEPPSPAIRHDAHGLPLAEVVEARELPVAVRLRIALDVLEQVHDEGGAVLVPRASASRMRLDKVLVGGDGVARLAPGGGTSGTATLLWEILAAAPSPSDPPPQLGEVAPDLPQPVLAVVARALEPGADFTRVKHLLTAFRSLVASTAANHDAVAEATGAEEHARVSGHGSPAARLSLDLSIDPVLQQLPEAAPRAARPAPAHDDHTSMAAEASPIPAASPGLGAAASTGPGESPSPPALEPSSSPAPPVAAAATVAEASPRPGPARPATSSLSRPSASGPGATSAFGGRPAPRAPSRPTPDVSRAMPAPSPRLPTPRPPAAPARTPTKPLSRPPPPRGAAAPPPPSIDIHAVPTGPTTPMPLPPAPSAPPPVYTPSPGPPAAMPIATSPGRPPLDSMVGLPFDAAARKRKMTIIAIAVAAGLVLLVVLFAALS